MKNERIGYWGVHASHSFTDKKITQALYTCCMCGYKYKDYFDSPIKQECPSCKAVMVLNHGHVSKNKRRKEYGNG